MNQQQAVTLIEQVLGNKFEAGRVSQFLAELLNQVDQGKRFGRRTGNYIPQAFREDIVFYECPSVYYDPAGNRLDLLFVKLKDGHKLAHARSFQRNFAAWYLKHNRDQIVDAVLVATFADDTDDWRLSFVKLEVGLSEQGGFTTTLTPARRYSYLVGKNEPSHTAKRQILPLLLGRENPTITQIEEAFNVETVTKQFFDQYKTLFLRLHEEIGKLLALQPKIASDFAAHNIAPANFAKKLLGQVVFLYFLQKKGWLGVTREGAWGSGTTDFLRRLFDKENIPYTNFFNDVLEPLFYEALAEQRTNDWYATLNCKIPFLNGGLFEPMNGYAWRELALNLPNAIFSNDENSAEGDSGTGILDVFDRYNFTVREEEPLEKRGGC